MTMEFTGERYVPALKGQIYYEHLHRYAIAARFSNGKRVLDIASGEGYGAALLAQDAAEVIGVDIDERSVEHAKRTYYAKNLRFARGSVTEIPLADASIDVVASFETIEHVGEHERMLDEFRRVLTPGGVVVLSSPNKLVYSDVPDFNNPFHVKELYFSELRDLLTRRFRHVALYGQRLSASSVVHPLAGSVSELASWYNGSIDSIRTGLPTLRNPVYFVAVCSDEPLSIDLSSAYVDAGDDLLEDIWVELNALRRQSRLTLEAAETQASLPDLRTVEALQQQSEERVAALSAQLEDRDHERDESTARIAALEAELAAVRAQHANEVAQLGSQVEDKLKNAYAQSELALANLRRQFENEAQQIVSSYESRVATAQEQLALESGRARMLRQELEDLRIEMSRAGDAVVATAAELHVERSRNKRLMEQLADVRAERVRDDAERLRKNEEALTSARRATTAAEASAALLREQVIHLTEALQRAVADSRALREVLSSRSWKLTSPLRRAAGLIRR